MKELILFLAFASLAYAQEPWGTLTGTVHDSSRAVVPGVQIRAVNKATALVWNASTIENGHYTISVLPVGEYAVTAALAGFQRMERPAVVGAGTTTTTDFSLLAGDLSTLITVDGTSPQLRLDSHTLEGTITRDLFEGLPVNGRNPAELAKLLPCVQPASRASSNRVFVPICGAPGGQSGRGVRQTTDGVSTMAVGNGGSAMGFSQDVVQELHVSTVNVDLSTGLTFAGAINAVTRSGGNDFHGSMFYYFRDHQLAAYPALQRDPANPDPFFQRRQFGLAVGGPIEHDRFFFFGNWERNEQRGASTTVFAGQDFAHLSRITGSPFFGDQASIRVDGRVSNAHTAFLRYAHDGNHAFAPGTNQRNAYPSAWSRQSAGADQAVLGLTSAIGPALVNDFRASYFYPRTTQVAPTEQDCPGCLGVGAPFITISQVGLALGFGSDIFLNTGRRFQLTDAIAWQTGTHRAKLGVDWEYNRGGQRNTLNEPAALTLYSPDQARQSGIPVPAEFRTIDEILALPLRSFTTAVGDPRVPQANGGLTRRWNTVRLFFQDAWQPHSRLTVNYGLAWNIDRNLNYDLTKPRLLAPILGEAGLAPTRKQWKNFSPSLGLAWTPSPDGRTVVRAGAGLFYDFLFNQNLDTERAALGPPGLGRQTFQGSSILNPLPGIPGVAVGTPLDFRKPTRFTGADLMAILPSLRASLLQKVADADRSVQQIQVSKTLGGTGLNPTDLPSPSALHMNIGVARKAARDFVLSADFVYRHFNHLSIASVDMNRYRRFEGFGGPVIPVCAETQRDDPAVPCSNGVINVTQNVGRGAYTGLHVRADKSFSPRFRFVSSWAYSKNTGTTPAGENGFNLDNWLENRGPRSTDFTHIVNLAGFARIPGRLELGLDFSYSSAPPFSAYLDGMDLNGDGTTGDLLPGSTVNAFNRSMDREDLALLVSQFNETYAGKTDAFGVTLPTLTLPARFHLDDNFHSLDLRLSRSFALKEDWRVTLIGEVFNVYNNANLSFPTGAGNLTNPAVFGQPTGRSSQVFGSGGPRAFQLAMKVSF